MEERKTAQEQVSPKSKALEHAPPRYDAPNKTEFVKCSFLTKVIVQGCSGSESSSGLKGPRFDHQEQQHNKKVCFFTVLQQQELGKNAYVAFCALSIKSFNTNSLKSPFLTPPPLLSSSYSKPYSAKKREKKFALFPDSNTHTAGSLTC